MEDNKNNRNKTILSFPMRETDTLDTTLLENKDRENLRKAHRKVVRDNLVTPRLFDLLVTKVYSEAEDIYHITQEEVINILRPKYICNKTIARVINVIIPTAKATQNSVASMIRFIDNKKVKRNTLADTLTKELEQELGGDI